MKPASNNSAAVADFHAMLAGKLTAQEVAEIAKVRAKREAEIDGEEAAAGAAIRHQHIKLGGTGRYPQKRRLATSGCGPRRRREHRDLHSIGKDNGPARLPEMPTFKPYKRKMVAVA